MLRIPKESLRYRRARTISTICLTALVFAPVLPIAATDESQEPDWSSSFVKSPVECRQLQIERSRKERGTREGRSSADGTYWKNVNLLDLVRPSEVSEIETSAWLSKGIYQCMPSISCPPQVIDGKEWRPTIDSQDRYANFEKVDTSSPQFSIVGSPPLGVLITTDIANTTPQTSDLDPSGFRAVVFQNPENESIFVVFRGTDITSIKDWATNVNQLFWKPEQYKAAEEFTKRVVLSQCGNGNVSPECLARFRVVGHSLGGGLAQHVARVNGLDGYTYNAAGLGLWSGTTHFTSSRLRDDARILHFFSQGYRLGNTYGMDFVPYSGIQASDANCEVPIDLPIWAWDSLSVGILTHNIERLASAISDIESGLAAAGTTDEVSISVVSPPELTNSFTMRLGCTANTPETTTVSVAVYNMSTLDSPIGFKLVGHEGVTGYNPGMPALVSFYDVPPGSYEVRISGREVLASRSIEILAPTSCR